MADVVPSLLEVHISMHIAHSVIFLSQDHFRALTSRGRIGEMLPKIVIVDVDGSQRVLGADDELTDFGRAAAEGDIERDGLTTEAERGDRKTPFSEEKIKRRKRRKNKAK